MNPNKEAIILSRVKCNCDERWKKWIDEAPIEGSIQNDWELVILTNDEIKKRLAKAIRKMLKGETNGKAS